MDVTRFGQSAVLVTDGNTRILIDPGGLSGDEVFALTGVDAVLVTHGHPDHFAPDGLAELRLHSPALRVLAPEEVWGQWDDSPRTHDEVLTDHDYDVGEITVSVVISDHEDIHARVPRLRNAGLILTGVSGVRLFHPGDSYAATPEGIDVLALPIAAPWASLRDTVAFADAVRPRRMFPIHDAHLSASGRALFWPWITSFSAADIEAFDPPLGTSTTID